ncbi:hypothetical protein [Tuberibacillus sp. Marseille-P3662]|uniref:hypothetical protein n=1 Tax=Tuberibacillus sp. Marseille-P3662 TaxID=1965358 RepID=UPI000A1CAB35|nr:hypothetical protein [Tuberibacillus sp. Marseille-P3662]
MGKAAEHKLEQIHYLQNRLALIEQMVGSLDEMSTSHDLDQLMAQFQALTTKINRFKEDWQKASS